MDEQNQKSESGKKNSPTPTRKEAEAKNKKSFLAAATTPADRKRNREEERARRLEMRAAYMRGDEKVLPARDRGPVRKFVRDYVDSQKMIGEYMFYLLILALFLSFVSRTPLIQLIVLVAMYFGVIVLLASSLILRHKILKEVKEKFPDAPTRGIGMYAFMRSTQIRKMRAPAPQVPITKGLFSKKKKS
jgi:Flp pilus assembly protein TadB